MTFMDSAFHWIGGLFKDQSTWHIAWLGFLALLALTVIAIVWFWNFLINNLLNHGGNH